MHNVPHGRVAFIPPIYMSVLNHVYNCGKPGYKLHDIRVQVTPGHEQAIPEAVSGFQQKRVKRR